MASPDLANVTLRRFITQANASYRKAGLHDMQLRIDARGHIDHAPGAPAEIQANATPDGIALMWKPGTDDRGPVSAYRVYRDGKPIATVRQSTWFVDRQAGASDDAGTHRYEVRSIDNAGTEGGVARLTPASQAPTTGAASSAASSAASGAAASGAAPSGAAASSPAGAETGATQAAAGAAHASAAPPAPQVTDLKKAGNDGFRLTWKPVTGATSYGIWQNGRLLGSVSDPAFAASVGSGDGAIIQIDALLANGTRTARTTPLQLRLGEQGGLQVAVAAPTPAPTPAQTSPPAAPATTPASAQS